MPVGVSNFAAKIVANTACFNRSAATAKSKRSEFWLLILRGIARLFGVSRNTLAKWLKKAELIPPLAETLAFAQADDVLEVDEMRSFVRRKTEKRWLWMVMCRRACQIVAYAIGERSEETSRQLWEQIPESYRRCQSFSDFWEAYAKVFPKETYKQVDKKSGKVNHQERWYGTLRQSCARFVRKTLSFSKSDAMHEIVTELYIVRYNLSLVT